MDWPCWRCRAFYTKVSESTLQMHVRDMWALYDIQSVNASQNTATALLNNAELEMLLESGTPSTVDSIGVFLLWGSSGYTSSKLATGVPVTPVLTFQSKYCNQRVVLTVTHLSCERF